MGVRLFPRHEDDHGIQVVRDRARRQPYASPRSAGLAASFVQWVKARPPNRLAFTIDAALAEFLAAPERAEVVPMQARPPVLTDTELLDWAQANLQHVYQDMGERFSISFLDEDGVTQQGESSPDLRSAIYKARGITPHSAADATLDKPKSPQ